MTFLIRHAGAEDAAALAELARRTFVETFGPVNRIEDVEAYAHEAFAEAIQRAEIEAADAATLVVEDGGRLAGYAQLRVAAPSARAVERPVELSRFYVDRPWHGRGVAQAFMSAVESEARVLGGATLWLGVWEHNLRAIAFYRKCGFVDIGAHPFLLGSDLQTDREMAKPL